LDGKFLGVVEVPKSYVGDANSIFEAIKIQRPKDIKKIDLLLSKGDASYFKKAIALKDKPVVNFIT
jgi:putative transposon-encoded protein